MPTVLLDKEQYNDILTQAALKAYDQSGIKNKSGKLRRSIQVTTTQDGFQLTFENYGLYQDSGVKGTVSGTTGLGWNNARFSFNPDKEAIGGILPIAARIKIHEEGIIPKPWIDKAIEYITETAAVELGIDIAKNIEKKFSEKNKTAEVKFNI
jgi:hypothetical protein